MAFSARALLFPLWLVLFVLGLLCLWAFVYGLIRDHHLGDPEIALDLARPAAAGEETFRVWGRKPYALHLSTLTHTPPFGDPLRATFEVSIRAPDGRTVYRSTFSGEELGHVRQENGDWSQLERLTLRGIPLRRWSVSARVLEPDPGWAGVSARVLLRRVRYDPGMGGLINYVLFLPGVVLLLASTLVGHLVAVRGISDVPFYLSGAVSALVVLSLLFRMVG